MRPLVNAVGQTPVGQSEGGPPASKGRDLERVLPVFLPSACVENNAWPGPYENLAARGVALAWAVPLAGGGVRYVWRETQREWEARQIDWRTRALQNLRASSHDPLEGGVLFREGGEPWLVSMMYSDGLGPSRLLLRDALQRVFPKGYRVALPECSRGFAFSRDLDHVDADTIENLIQRSYSRSEQPLSAEILDPGDLWTVAG
jgi:hypothetical protein